MTNKNLKLDAGFSLLETVVAISILIGAVVGPVALVSRSLFGFPFAKNKLVAINLAQEGVELIRAIRDQNMQCVIYSTPGWTWDTDFDGSGTLQGVGRMIDATNNRAISCLDSFAAMTLRNNPDMPTTGTCTATKLELDSDGRYGYNLAGGTDTLFSRCVNITTPAANEPAGCIPAVGNDCIPRADILDIFSTVTWSEHGIPRSEIIGVRLYNWKKP